MRLTPTSDQIVQDIMRWERALQLIVDAEDALVPSMDFRTGRRKTKKSKEFVYHPDCQAALDAKMAKFATYSFWRYGGQFAWAINLLFFCYVCARKPTCPLGTVLTWVQWSSLEH